MLFNDFKKRFQFHTKEISYVRSFSGAQLSESRETEYDVKERPKYRHGHFHLQ